MTNKDLVLIIRKDSKFFNYSQSIYKKIPKGKEKFFIHYNSNIYKVPFLLSSKKRSFFNFKIIKSVNKKFKRNDFKVEYENK